MEGQSKTPVTKKLNESKGDHTKLIKILFVVIIVIGFIVIIYIFLNMNTVTDEYVSQKKILDSNKKNSKDNLHIVPYLFDEPLVLFERNTNALQIDSINTSIKKLNKKISTIKNISKKCDKYNDGLSSPSYLKDDLDDLDDLDEYDIFYKQFKQKSDECVDDKTCELNMEEGIIFPIQCKNKESGEDDYNCMKDYFKNYVTGDVPACDIDKCSIEPNNSDDSIAKYDKLPDPLKNIDTIFQTVYSTYIDIDKEKYTDIKGLKDYKVCISKIKSEKLDKLEKQLKEKTTEKNKLTENNSFYQILFG